MATETAKFALIGMIIGAVVFGSLIAWVFFSAPNYTPAEKEQINIAYAVNCSKCLEKEGISCSPKELIYSHWGAICGDKYVPKNCTSCKQIK